MTVVPSKEHADMIKEGRDAISTQTHDAEIYNNEGQTWFEAVREDIDYREEAEPVGPKEEFIDRLSELDEVARLLDNRNYVNEEEIREKYRKLAHRVAKEIERMSYFN